jgi:hypothetical protein
VRIHFGLMAATAAAWAFQAVTPPAGAIIQDQTHFSQAMRGPRVYRVYLPPAYPVSQKRYPVIYWFHGYETVNPERAAEFAAYVAAHDAILVDSGPVETSGPFPLYFPELVGQIDKTLRTIPDRDHRAVAGFAMGGYLAMFEAGKSPDLVSSASSLMAPAEALVGPAGFDVDYNQADFPGGYDGVRTHLVTQGGPGVRSLPWREALDFHLHAFANPLPKPAVLHHADAYPNFAVWGWEVLSDRRQPGFTVLENISRSGFRSAVREWIPGGAAIAKVKLSIISPPLYAPASSQPVTYIHLQDGKLRRTTQRADALGRLTFDLDGDAYEVGVGAGPVVALTGFEITGAAWATAGQPVKLQLRFCNKGAARSATAVLKWESPNANVKFAAPTGRLFGLSPGESAALPLTFTVGGAAPAVVRIVAADGANRLSFDVPLFPQAEPVSDFQIADGRTVTAYQHAVEPAAVTLGEGNGDGHAAPGESFAILLPEGGALRAAELFTNDECVDNSARIADSSGNSVSVKYSLPAIRARCEPGHVVHALARIVIPGTPDRQTRYAAIEFPVWYRNR